MQLVLKHYVLYKKILLKISNKGYVRCVNKYNILQHELTTAMQYQLKN